MAFMRGNLCYQIEHHLFPDLPSNRYAEICVRVRELCEKYDLPYTTGSLVRQYAQSFRTILKLALPDKLLKATSDDAPETTRSSNSASARECGRVSVSTPAHADGGDCARRCASLRPQPWPPRNPLGASALSRGPLNGKDGPAAYRHRPIDQLPANAGMKFQITSQRDPQA